jgi:sporulation protein YlmC with PRC-barrel domain
MKTLFLAFLTAAGLGAFLASSSAAQSDTSATLTTTAGHLQSVRLGLITKTTGLIGMKVKDRSYGGLGRMEDVLLDLPTGQAVAALLSGGSDNQLTPVPARTFWTASKSRILVNTDRKMLKCAPCIGKAELPRTLEMASLSRSFSHFGQGLPEMPAACLGKLSSAAGLVHQQLLSQSNEVVGQVEDIMVDLPVGRVVYLVVQPTAGAGSAGILYVVPPQSVLPDATGRALVLNADQAHFLAGPRFQKQYWTELSRPELAAAVQQHYRLQASAAISTPARVASN